MKKYLRNSGLATVYVGATLLLAGYALGWTDNNVFLLSAAALVVVGAALHVWLLKKESKY